MRMDQANTASAAVARRLGFSVEGEEALNDIQTLTDWRQPLLWATARPRRTS